MTLLGCQPRHPSLVILLDCQPQYHSVITWSFWAASLYISLLWSLWAVSLHTSLLSWSFWAVSLLWSFCTITSASHRDYHNGNAILLGALLYKSGMWFSLVTAFSYHAKQEQTCPKLILSHLSNTIYGVYSQHRMCIICELFENKGHKFTIAGVWWEIWSSSLYRIV